MKVQTLTFILFVFFVFATKAQNKEPKFYTLKEAMAAPPENVQYLGIYEPVVNDSSALSGN